MSLGLPLYRQYLPTSGSFFMSHLTINCKLVGILAIQNPVLEMRVCVLHGLRLSVEYSQFYQNIYKFRGHKTIHVLNAYHLPVPNESVMSNALHTEYWRYVLLHVISG